MGVAVAPQSLSVAGSRAAGYFPGAFVLLPALAGLAALYVPTVVDLVREVWPDPQQGHGPFILAIALGAAAIRLRRFLALRGSAPVAGFALAVAGLLFYVLGRSQEILFFETGSLVPVAAGTILALRGWRGLRLLWFPVLFLAFWVIWPGWIIDGVTGGLKSLISEATVELLYRFGYPIGQSGVAITVGPYQLLVADACSGLNSLLTLCAVGVLYLYISRYRSVLRNIILALSFIPIAILANFLRVVALVLITYHFGAEAGEGFLHDFTGLFLFSVALLVLFVFDLALGVVVAMLPGLFGPKGRETAA